MAETMKTGACEEEMKAIASMSGSQSKVCESKELTDEGKNPGHKSWESKNNQNLRLNRPERKTETYKAEPASVSNPQHRHCV